MSINKISVH